jgi:methylisocitrate lyase
MYFTKKTSLEKRLDFKKSLKKGKLLRFPGAYNPLSAKLISEIGFDGVYISGGVMANDLGLPDIGLTTLDQISYRSSQITRVTDLPTIVDADTGFKDCKKTVFTLEAKGLTGCHIEDQIEQKRCGHLDNKELITKEEMVIKIKDAVSARKDKNFLIIARTDANSVEGLDKTIDRIKAYEDAGADMIFPEAMKDESEFEKVRKISNGYLLANMTEFGKSKLLNKSELEKLGYNLVIYPVTTQRLAMKNVEDGLKSIFKTGDQNNIIDNMQTRKRLYELVEYEKYNTPDNKITDFSTEGHE